MLASARFIRAIRWIFIIRLVMALEAVGAHASACWVGERTGLNRVLMSYLDREAATESHGR